MDIIEKVNKAIDGSKNYPKEMYMNINTYLSFIMGAKDSLERVEYHGGCKFPSYIGIILLIDNRMKDMDVAFN